MAKWTFCCLQSTHHTINELGIGPGKNETEQEIVNIILKNADDKNEDIV